MDGPPNSLPPELLRTKRQAVLSVEPMSRELIESIPEFQDLIGKLKKCKLDNAVWQILGGCPANYLGVQRLIVNCPDDAIADRVRNHLISILNEAVEVVQDSSANTKAIVKLFRERKILQLPKHELEDESLEIDLPNEVFKKVEKVGTFVEPATSAVGLVIRENVRTGQDEVNLVSAVLVGLSLLGVTPRVGLVRALTLGWRSAIKTTYPLSVRTAEVVALRKDLQSLQKGQYVAIIGGKGNGKSCLIGTCLNLTFGAIKTSVS